jgi:hypothetical protein
MTPGKDRPNPLDQSIIIVAMRDQLGLIVEIPKDASGLPGDR